jgi:hypothetical protein
MNKHPEPFRGISGERGMALISALLLLLVVSLLAVGLSMDSSMDVRLAAYQKFQARAFGFAESGMMAGADILESNVADSGWDIDPGDEFPHLSADYDGDLKIWGPGTFYLDENPDEDRTMEMTDDIAADVIIQKVVSKVTSGSAMQVAAGYAGVGKGLGGGGAQVVYNVESTGYDSNNCRTCVAMNYRMVTK